MRRNLDLIREIILEIESFEHRTLGDVQEFASNHFSGTNAENLYHIKLLIDDGYFGEHWQNIDGSTHVMGLSMKGHDLADTFRDDEIFAQTKAGLSAAGGWTLGLAAELAKAYLKDRLGL